MEPCSEGSDSEQGTNSVDSAKKVENGPVSVTFSDPMVLHCRNCFEPLGDLVYLCGYAHVYCFDCGGNLNYQCRECPLKLDHSRAFDMLLQSIVIPCPNEKYGCMRSSMNYCESKKHKCIYVPCCCPISGCDFVAPSKVLSEHFIHKHGDTRIQFLYDISFFVSLKSNDETIILQEQNDGKLFVLNNSNVRVGNAVNISFIGPKPYGQGYRYKILARSQTCSLKLQSFTESIQQGTLEPFSSEFLVIPSGFFGSSEAFRLEICISSKDFHSQRLTDGGFDEDANAYCFYARSHYKKGDQVLLCYGTYTNLELLEHYGFLLQENPNDKIFIPLELVVYFSTSWPKESLYIDHNGKPSFALLAALRLWATPQNKRRSVGHLAYSGSQLSVDNEIFIMKRLSKTCDAVLKNLPTSIEDDNLLLNAMDSSQDFFIFMEIIKLMSSRDEVYTFLEAHNMKDAQSFTHKLLSRKVKMSMERWKLAVQWRLRYKKVLVHCISYCREILDSFMKEEC